MVDVHQLADRQRRDAMAHRLQDLRFRALRPDGNMRKVGVGLVGGAKKYLAEEHRGFFARERWMADLRGFPSGVEWWVRQGLNL